MSLNEQWVEIERFPNYLVSSEGRIQNKYTGKILVSSGHYPRLNLCMDGCCSKQSVHTLVAEAFIGPVGPDFEVNHIDGNRYNNLVTNLEIVTPSQNVIHAFATGLRKPTNKMIRCVETGEVFVSYKDAAERFGLTRSHVSQVIHGRVSHAKGYHFEAVE